MKIFTDSTQKKSFLKVMGTIILALALIQILRAALMSGMWYLVRPGENLALLQFLNGISFIMVGVILLAWIRPSLRDLSLDWDDISRRSRFLYAVGGLILITLVIMPFFLGFETDVLVMSLVFGLIVPAFEELLFRGYLWNQIQGSADMVNPGLVTWLTVTLLFALWHLGYLDVLIWNPLKMDLLIFLASKLSIGLVLGLITGYLRLKTGKTYASFLFHGFWNVFAP